MCRAEFVTTVIASQCEFKKVMKKKVKSDLNWYAVYTNSRSEKKVYERLEAAGYDCFLPLVTTLKQWSDRKKKVSIPLIKSYVFIKGSNSDLNSVVQVPGVVAVLKYLGKPAIVKEAEIENLKILTNNSEAITTIAPCNLENGKPVQVIQGPFEGLIAVYITHRGKHRVIVEVEALNSFTEVTLPLSHIKEL